MTSTITQTITQSQSRLRDPRVTSVNYTLFRGDPGDDGDDGGDDGDDYGSAPSVSVNDILPCDKIINVYASIPILYKLRGSYVGKNGKKYHIIAPKDNIYGHIQNLLDPVEFKIYEPLLFLEQRHVLIPYRDDKKVPKKGQEWLFVRCKNNSLHIVAPSDLVNNVATDRYLYGRASPSDKEVLAKKNNYAFEREKNNVYRKVKTLDSCDTKQTPLCKEVFVSSCSDETKDPELLKSIYQFGVRTSKDKNRTWEEVCVNDGMDVQVLQNKTLRKSASRSRTQIVSPSVGGKTVVVGSASKESKKKTTSKK